MTRRIGSFVPVLMAFSLGMAAAQVPSLSGVWQVNVEKSRWGKARRPVSVTLMIDHREPLLTYSGEVVDELGDAARSFGFNGAIDGKPYPMTRSFGSGKIVLKRAAPAVIASVFESDDGRYTETARTTLSRDGRTLTRQIQVRGPDSTISWTEVYEKK